MTTKIMLKSLTSMTAQELIDEVDREINYNKSKFMDGKNEN